MRAWVLVGLLETVASAQPHERAALSALDLAADAPAYLRARATAQIEEGLAATGYDVVSTPHVPPNLARCRSSDCMREVGRVLGVRAVLVAAITPRGESSVITLHLFDGVTGRELAELTEVCDLCGESELIEHLGIATSAVRARAAEPHAHPVMQSTSIVPGVVTGAAGVVVVATGIFLVALDGRSRCDGPAPCSRVYNTEALGVVGITVGAAAVVLGGMLVVRAHDRTFHVAPAAGGATVSMTIEW